MQHNILLDGSAEFTPDGSCPQTSDATTEGRPKQATTEVENNDGRSVACQTRVGYSEQYEAVLEVTRRYLLRTYMCVEDEKLDLPQKVLLKESVLCQRQKVERSIDAEEFVKRQNVTGLLAELDKKREFTKSLKRNGADTDSLRRSPRSRKRPLSPLPEESQPVDPSLGKPVYARWTDGCFYPAVVKKAVDHRQVQVQFDDGYKSNVDRKALFPLNIIQKNSSVMVQVSRNCYEPAIVLSVTGRTDRLYTVEMDSGKNKQVRAGAIMVTSDQITHLCASQGRRTSKRGISDDDADKQIALSKQHSSSTNVNGESFEGVDELFDGITFLLTISSRLDRLERDRSSDSLTRSKGEEWDKKRIRRLILSHGGLIHDNHCVESLVGDLQERIRSGPQDTVLPTLLLISNSESRTIKYLIALALGIPCLSCRWIIDSIEAGQLLPCTDYKLPNGTQLETGKLIFKNSRSTPALSDRKAIVLSDNEEFRSTCKALLLAAECEILLSSDPFKSLNKALFSQSDFIISDQPYSFDEQNGWLNKSKMLTLEWVIQSIIAGSPRNPKRHASYCWSTA